MKDSKKKSIDKKKTKKIKQTYRDRIWELDFIRGVCLILMLLYHFAVIYEVVFFPMWEEFLEPDNFIVKAYYFITEKAFSPFVEDFFHFLVVGVFFTVAGLSVTLSRKTYKSFLKTALFAGAITVVTSLLDYVLGSAYFTITHGIFHIFALCYLVHLIFCIILKNKYIRSGALLAAGIFFLILFKRTEAGLVTWEDNVFSAFFVDNSHLPSFLDSVHLIPWIGYFLIGASLSPFIYPAKKSLLPFLNKKWHLPVTFFGRHPVSFYALHILLSIIFMIIVGLIFVPKEWITQIFGS